MSIICQNEQIRKHKSVFSKVSILRSNTHKQNTTQEMFIDKQTITKRNKIWGKFN